MNAPLLIAAILCFLIGALHSLLGEKFVVRKLTSTDLTLRGDSAFMRRVVWFAWHLTTLLLWGFGAVLLKMSVGLGALVPDKTMVAWTFVACAVLSLIATRARHFSWVVFAAIAILIFLSGPRA